MPLPCGAHGKAKRGARDRQEQGTDKLSAASLPAAEFRSRLARPARSATFPAMSTLAEIESAIETLPSQQQKELFRHLAVRLGGGVVSGDAPVSEQRRSARGFPVVTGRAPFTDEDVARIEGEA